MPIPLLYVRNLTLVMNVAVLLGMKDGVLRTISKNVHLETISKTLLKVMDLDAMTLMNAPPTQTYARHYVTNIA